jgi:RND family efflux transporter MFP subunit
MKINFKSKKIWGGVLVAIILVILLIPKGPQTPKYETVRAEKGTIKQTVDATGSIQSSNGVSLRFQMSGNIGEIVVKEGDPVKVGQFMGSLNLPELDAAISQAQASLSQKVAGATDEQVLVAERQLDSAKVSLEKAEKALTDTIKLGEENLTASNYQLEKAEKNLLEVTKLAEENMRSKYNYTSSSLDDANIKIYNSYTLAESVKNSYFNSTDQQGIKVQSILRSRMITARDGSKAMLTSLDDTNRADVDAAVNKMITYLDEVLSSLTEIRDFCDEHTYKTSVPDSVRNSIDTQKSLVSSAKNSIISLKNDISVLKVQNENNINNANDAIISLKNDISVLKIQNNNNENSARSAIDVAKSNVAIQEANLKSLTANPRDVDLAYYRAALEQAKANKQKSILSSPVDGVVSKVNKKQGELTGPSDVIFEVISPHQEIVLDVSETDVVKLSLEDEAEITFDAFGQDTKFKGKVMTIEPSSTDIQGVVYYKVKIDFPEEGGRVRPGMTANVVIETDKRDDAVFLPNRAVTTKDDKKYVKVLVNGQVEEKEIKLGIKGDGGVVEVISGLGGGEEVILKTLD